MVGGRVQVYARLIEQGVHHMPRPHVLPTGPSPNSIECPPGYDLRLFECDKCDRISTRLVPSDPMKTGVAPRWLVGQLKPPGESLTISGNIKNVSSNTKRALIPPPLAWRLEDFRNARLSSLPYWL
jgi:hypothetical protein